MSRSSRIPMCLRTSSNNFLASPNPDGTPILNASNSFSVAAARIFDADIPVTPSASGSRSPADTTLTESKSYRILPFLSGCPLYVVRSLVNSATLSEPATIIKFLYPSLYILSAIIIAVFALLSALMFLAYFLNILRIYATFRECGRGSVAGFCVNEGYILNSLEPATFLQASISFSWPVVGGLNLPKANTMVSLASVNSLNVFIDPMPL